MAARTHKNHRPANLVLPSESEDESSPKAFTPVFYGRPVTWRKPSKGSEDAPDAKSMFASQSVTATVAEKRMDTPCSMLLVLKPGIVMRAGQHVRLEYRSHFVQLSRPYTPIAASPASITLLVKVYEHEGMGRMSKYLHKLEVGETIDVSGPYTDFDIALGGVRHLCLVAGGTGITPMYQLIDWMSSYSDSSQQKERSAADGSHPSSDSSSGSINDLRLMRMSKKAAANGEMKTVAKLPKHITLLYSASRVDQFHLKSLLDERANAASFPFELDIHYFVSKPHDDDAKEKEPLPDWAINEPLSAERLWQFCPDLSDDKVCMVASGPDGFLAHLRSLLEALRWDTSRLNTYSNEPLDDV